MGPKKLNLSNICNGAAAEVFEHELAKVLENIADPNTNAEALRGLTLSFKLKPNTKRSVVEIAYSVKSSMSGVNTEKSSAFIAMEAGELGLYSMDVNQGILPLETVKAPVVEEIKPVAERKATMKAAPQPSAN